MGMLLNRDNKVVVQKPQPTPSAPVEEVKKETKKQEKKTK